MKSSMIAVAAVALGHAEAEHGRANPIRKVVGMLQNIQRKVEAEADKEEQLFKKYMCYCSTAGGDLQKSIADSTTKVPQLQSDIEAAEAQKVQLGEDLVKHQADRTAAKAVIAEATAMREKEATAFASLKAESSSNIAAITKAVAALEKGAGGAFLQSSAASVLRNLVKVSDTMDAEDKSDLAAFLESAQSSDYSPQSGQITGILKAAGDEMSAALAEATKAETDAVASYGDLMAAKKKEVAACTAAIEDKTVRSGEVAVSIAQMKGELSDSEEALIDDQKFLKDLDKNCATKQGEWDEIVKTRAEEQVALSETIKMLNSDDALELFKKALPSSFIQMKVSAASVRARALDVLQAAHKPNLGFIVLALNGKKVGFAKVIKMIDDMVVLLKTEQTDDDNKKEYCDIQFDAMDDKKKGLERTVSDAETAIEDAKESIASLTTDVEALGAGLKALDKSTAEATEQRKEENSDFTELMAQDTAAKQILDMAKNRLNKFYNPKLYVAPPKVEEAELAQIQAHAQQKAAPPPPPQAPGAYSKKSEESNGVIAMIDSIIKDLDKEMTVGEAEEKNAQGDYEQTMKDAAEKRAADSKSIEDKTGAKADTQAALEDHSDGKDAAAKELFATLKVIDGLHGECDWLIKYFDIRRDARTNEVDALGKAKAVLSGADYSLLQMKSSKLRR